MPGPHFQLFCEYTTFRKYACWADFPDMPPRKRAAFLGAVRSTFRALLLCAPPALAAHLGSTACRQVIHIETQKWLVCRNRIAAFDNWYWVLIYNTPHQETYENNGVLRYMVGNISCACPMLLDISELLGEINHIATLDPLRLRPFIRSISCMPKATHELKFPREWHEWINTVCAPAIAETAFAVGWERRLLDIVKEFAFEIIGRMGDSPHRKAMLLFLQSIKTSVHALQDNERDCCIMMSICLARNGIKDEQHLIMPGPRRYNGMLLAMMPRYLRLPKHEFLWGIERHPSVFEKIRAARKGAPGAPLGSKKK